MKGILCLFTLLTFTALFSQGADFTKVDAEIKPYQNASLSGIVRYVFKVDQPLDSLVFDAIGMEFSNIYFEGKKVTHRSNYDGKKLKIGLNLVPGRYNIRFGFTAQPKQTVYFIEGERDSTIQQIWTQGQGKYTSHWLPSFDDMNEKLEFDLTVHVPPKYTVIANGRLKRNTATGNIRTFRFDMENAMSSYLAAFVVGDFDKKVIHSKSGIPIELYFEPQDSLNFEPTYRYTKEIFDFLEQEIGVAYPWQNYKQVPVQDFLYAGMENTTCTIFSNQYVIDSTAFVDKNYVNVNAHELAHQWFGNLVTEVSGDHHWLHEGFATYYAYVAEKALFGDDHFYWKLYETANTLNNLSENGDGDALTNPNANSLTFYEKGAWALVMLRERVGDVAFREGIRNYLNSFAFDNATIAEFLSKMEEVSGQDLAAFRREWLESETFPWEPVKQYLTSHSETLNLFFNTNSGEAINTLLKSNGELSSSELQVAWIKKFHDSFDEKIMHQLLAMDDLKVRQAVAIVTDSIPNSLRPAFETLLTDKSYITKEVALFKLWQAFPENRSRYLNTLDGVLGLPNKNIRLLWLTLALITPEFQPQNKRAFYTELNGFTASHFNFEIRQLAFKYLYQIQALSDEALKSLIRASNHHVWQFKKSSRNLIRDINATEEGRFRLESLKEELSAAEQTILEEIINK